MLSFHQLFPALKQTSDQLQTHTHIHTPGEAGWRDLPPAPPARLPPLAAAAAASIWDRPILHLRPALPFDSDFHLAFSG